MRIFLALVGTFVLAYLGVSALAGGNAVVPALGRFTLGTRSHWYPVYGALAYVMGVGWLSGALAVGLRFSLPRPLAEAPAVRNTSAVAFLIFGVCLIYVAFTSVLTFFFPAL